jgi:hypothetical protein
MFPTYSTAPEEGCICTTGFITGSIISGEKEMIFPSMEL